MKLLIIILLLSPLTFSQNLKDYDFEKGTSLGVFNPESDSFRFSLAAGSNYKLSYGDQLDFEIQLHKKVDVLNSSWAVFQFKRVSAAYSEIANELVSTIGHANSEAQTPKGSSEQTILTIGAGYAHRFQMLSQFTDSSRVFEMFSFIFNYVKSSDELTGRDYSGYGITCDFGIHKRISKSFFAGIKVSYNVASVIRSAISDEPKEDRSLSYTWTTVGLEIGSFF